MNGQSQKVDSELGWRPVSTMMKELPIVPTYIVQRTDST